MLPILFQIGIGFGGFQSMLSNMMSLGFFQFLFPFLLSLAIIYGVLNYAAGDKFGKNANGLIALILSFFVMLFAGANPGIVQFLQNISGAGLILATGFLFLIILFGMMGFKVDELFKDGAEYRWAFILAIIAIAIAIFFGAGGSALLPGVSISSDWTSIIFFVIILVLVLWFLGDKGNGSSKKE